MPTKANTQNQRKIKNDFKGLLSDSNTQNE